MVCHHCGMVMEEEVKFCPNCGAGLVQEEPHRESRQTESRTAPVVEPQPAQAEIPGKGFAIAGMVCGIVSIFWLHFLLGALGLIFGLIARSKGYRKGMTTAAIVCGAVGLGIGVLLFVLMVLAAVLSTQLILGAGVPALEAFAEIVNNLIWELM